MPVSPGQAASSANISGTVATYFDPATPSVAASFSGSIATYFQPSNPNVTANAGTGTFRIGDIPGSVAVYFSPANPTVNASFSAASMQVVPTDGSRVLFDSGYQAERVLIAGSQTNASLQVSGITNSINAYLGATAGTLNVKLDPSSVVQISNTPSVTVSNSPIVTANAGTGTFNVQLDPGHTLGNINSLNSITNTVNIAFSPASPSMKMANYKSTLVSAADGDMVFLVTDASARIILSGQSQTLAVYFDKANPSVNVGSPTITGITNSINAYIGGTAGTIQVKLDPSSKIAGSDSTINVRVGQLDGSVAVYFSPSNPSVNATFSSSSMEVVPTTGSRKITDDASQALRVLIAGSQTAASLTINGSISNTGFNVNNSPTITGITNTIAALPVTANNGTATDENHKAVRVLIAGSQTAASLTVNGTVTTNAGTGTMTVQFDPGHTLGKVEPGAGTFQVYLPDTGHELGSIRGITNSINVYLGATGGSLNVKIDPSYSVVNISSTIVAPIATAGNVSGVSVSGNTIAGPTSGRALKVYGFSLSTTAQTSLTAKFTNGAGTSPTTFYEMALQAPSQGIAGSNMVVNPPAYLFATAVGSTLSLLLDSASKVHYSVYYFEESA